MTPPPLPIAPKKAGCLKIGLIGLGSLFGGILLLAVIGTMLPKTPAKPDIPAPATSAPAAMPDASVELRREPPASTPPAPPDPAAEKARAEKRAANVARVKAEREAAIASEEAAAKAKAAERERLVTQIKWKEISAIYSLSAKATDIVKDEKWKAYKGREVRWTGEVVEVSKDFLGNYTLAVKMAPDTFTFDVHVKLRGDQTDAAFKLSKGDKVTFEARLVAWGSLMPITADNGVILH